MNDKICDTVDSKTRNQTKTKTKPKPETKDKVVKSNPWLDHLAQFRKDHPIMTFKEALQAAKLTYKK